MRRLFYFVMLAFAAVSMACTEKPVETFTNPLLPDGPDPWAIWHDGYYYYMHTTGVDLQVWKTKDITDLANAERKTERIRATTPRAPPTIWDTKLEISSPRV
jgi:GH43 family beta-xylosidase